MSSAIAVVGTDVATEIRLSSLQMIKVPSGGLTQWTYEDVLGQHTVPELVGIIAFVTEPTRDLWPTQGSSSKGTHPYMRSLDGRVAYIVGTDPGTLDTAKIAAAKIADTKGYDCSKLPEYFDWSKSPAGRPVPPLAGPTCIVGLIRDGERAPIYIRLSKANCPVVWNESKSFSYRGYVQKLLDKNTQPYSVITSLSLEEQKSANRWTKIRASTVGVISDPDVLATMKHWYEKVGPTLRPTIESPQSAIDVVPF